MESTHLTKAKKAYSTADHKQKDILESIFGKKPFEKPKTDWIKLFDQFCKENKVKAILPYAKPSTPDQEATNAFMMITIITRHYRSKHKPSWKPDWSNSNEYKWYPWFAMDSGFRFGGPGYVYTLTGAGAGSRFCFPTSEMAKEVGTKYECIYEKLQTLN